jgi:uncharacterized protein YbaR (Trm112 family)
MSIDPSLLEIFACPQCHAPLRQAEPAAEAGAGVEAELVCTADSCGLAYPVRDGIPALLVDEARRPA